jgi:hypothetical protein
LKFTVVPQRAFAGNDIDIHLDAEKGETIAIVKVCLDDLTIWEKPAEFGCVDWQMKFSGIGDAAPGMEHKLVITVIDDKGESKSSEHHWQDS